MFHSLLTHPNSLFGHFDRLQRDLDELVGTAGLPTSIRSVAGGTLPQINVGQTPQNVEVYAFAPGLDPDKIEVTLDRGVLRLAGERTAAPAEGERTRFHARERAAGRFDRTVTLPDDVDPERVTASYRDGVLQVSVGRREAVQPKRIAIQ